MDENLLVDAYQSIITDLERPKITKQTDGENINTIRDFDYYLQKEDMVSYFIDKFNVDRSSSEELFQTLLQRGFIVELPEEVDKENVDAFRSLHMDVLLRSAEIRTKWSYMRYIVSPKFLLHSVTSPSKQDRKYVPSSEGLINNYLYNSIKEYFGLEKASDDYINILKDYLPQGLDGYQAYSLGRMLQSDKQLNVITAPTGSGKTEIFLLFILAKLIRSKANGESERAVFVYPRKTLSVDQSSRMIRLLKKANDYGYRLTFGLRDGTTPKKHEVKDGQLFRGIKCPECGSDLVYKIQNQSVRCDSCNSSLDFINSTRNSMGKNPPEMIVTNMWALEVRIMDNLEKDLNVDTFRDLGSLVIDEAHEYTGLGGGLISYLVNLILSTSEKNPKIIVSSATIPSPKEFASKISGIATDHCQIYDFNETAKKLNEDYGIQFTGKRLVIIGVFDINPRYSWSTYCMLWATMTSFLNYSYKLDAKKHKPQSIVFINNIKELRRTYRGYEENISLGEPRDHLIGPQEYGQPLNSLDPYSYWHYLTLNSRNSVLNLFRNDQKLTTLLYRAGEMHTQATEDERKRVIESLSGEGEEIATVFSTSSLELGVDYKNVSFILNTGISNPLSLAQRIGRGGRDPNTMRTVLGIVLARNIPSEYLAINDPETVNRLTPAIPEDTAPLPIATDNPQVKKRGKLVEAISSIAKDGKRTYASGKPIKSWTKFKGFMSEIMKHMEGEQH